MVCVVITRERSACLNQKLGKIDDISEMNGEENSNFTFLLLQINILDFFNPFSNISEATIEIRNSVEINVL